MTQKKQFFIAIKSVRLHNAMELMDNGKEMISLSRSEQESSYHTHASFAASRSGTAK